MKKGRVLVTTHELPEIGLNKLYDFCEDVYVNPTPNPMTKEELKEAIKDKDAMVCLLADTISSDVIESAPNLKIIADYAVGYNNINVKTATSKGIYVTNTPDVLTDATADVTWALLLSITRRIVEGDKYMRSGIFKGWSPQLLLGRGVYGKTIGIVGAGRIGSAVAHRATGFNMNILYTSPSPKPHLEEKCKAKKVGLEELLKESDFVCLHCPLVEETKHLIGEKELNMMKKTSYLINVARGPVVDEKALVKVLRENRIAGAALDVFEREPEMEEGLDALDNVVVIPHLGSATIEARNEMAKMVADNVIATLKGEVPPNCVNPEAK